MTDTMTAAASDENACAAADGHGPVTLHLVDKRAVARALAQVLATLEHEDVKVEVVIEDQARAGERRRKAQGALLLLAMRHPDVERAVAAVLPTFGAATIIQVPADRLQGVIDAAEAMAASVGAVRQ